MKKLILPFAFMLISFAMQAQSVVDTVSLGAGYANQVWYSLENDEQGSAPKNNWDLAFETGGFGTSIHINSVIGTMLWTYPHADTTGWATIDTTGMTAWTAKYNSDTSWSIGAFDKGMVTSNPNDVGWGIYNNITHVITGDSLFVIKLSNGAYKKLWIKNVINGGYNFVYANLDGTNTQTYFILKSNFNGKNFGYYSLQTNSELNREPAPTANWDLLFTQYTGFVPTPYTLSGVLQNKGIIAAQADNVANPATYENWFDHSFETAINVLGADWKTYSGAWYLSQDTVYFVKSKQGDIWKIIFTGFGGAGNGNFIFSKEKISTVGLDEINASSNIELSVYPNPVVNGSAQLVYSLNKDYTHANYTLIDMNGKIVANESLNNNAGFYTHSISTANLEKGVYFVNITIDNFTTQQKLIVQ